MSKERDEQERLQAQILAQMNKAQVEHDLAVEALRDGNLSPAQARVRKLASELVDVRHLRTKLLMIEVPKHLRGKVTVEELRQAIFDEIRPHLSFFVTPDDDLPVNVSIPNDETVGAAE